MRKRESVPCYEQPQKSVYQIQHASQISSEYPLCIKSHSVESWLLLKQLNARGGEVSFRPLLVTACVTLVRKYGNYLSETLCMSLIS